MTVQQYLKDKIKEAGISQRDVAKRIGWTVQNVNYKLQHANSRFSSVLMVAEGIGLAAKIKPCDEQTPPPDEAQIIKKACKTDISTENFQSVLLSMGCELAFDWRTPGDMLYMMHTQKNASSADQK